MTQPACRAHPVAGVSRLQGPEAIGDLLARYRGRLLDVEAVTEYEQWALGLFHDRTVVVDPTISVTLQLDITEAVECYRGHYASAGHGSLTAFLTWKLLVALGRQATLNVRRLEGRWYEFRNLPLFFPVAVGGACRFQDALVEDVAQTDWETFSRKYGRALQWARAATHRWALTALTWSVATFVGNLPYLNFNSLALPASNLWTGRPCFYFGQRTVVGGRTTVPLSVTLDHSNGDPYVLNQLMQDYQRLLVE